MGYLKIWSGLIFIPLADLYVIPTNPCAVEKELRRVQALMQLEQKEDLAQFKLKNAKASIEERQKRGLTWYPVIITEEDLPDWALAGGFKRMRLRKLSRHISRNGPTAATNRICLNAAQADRLAQCAKVMANIQDAKLPV